MDKHLLDILACPVTKGKLILNGEELWSTQAGLAYPIRDGIPVLIESEARQLSHEEISAAKSKPL
ncbi:Trm112 family protein [Granulosicoccaceae sp. 1_MG-2023]|nr:Trm112 family protein [Granulosicoccaceae sp. 1_MG-2023]